MKMLKNRWLLAALLAVLSACAVLGWARFIEPAMLRHVQQTLPPPDKLGEKSGGEGKTVLKIALFGDTHFSSVYPVSRMRRIAEKINREKPDVVIFTGDLIDSLASDPVDTAAIAAGLAEIEAPLGKFAVFGNHDYGGGAQYTYEDVMAQGGFVLLVNDSYQLTDQVCLTGMDDYLLGRPDHQLLQRLGDDSYQIVISHAADAVAGIQGGRQDLILSGHTHGGQVRLPFFTKAFLPTGGKKYDRGLYTLQQGSRPRLLYVTSGIGTTKVPLRLACPPEVVFLEVELPGSREVDSR